jgi:DNA modification methylase
LLRKLKVELRRIDSLKPNPKNPRVHSRKKLEKLAAGFRTTGVCIPFLINDEGCLITGHARLGAAKLAGIDFVPVIVLAGLTPAQEIALALADNRLAEEASWDPKLLSAALKEIAEIDVEFDLSLTGFETAEIDLLIQGPVFAADDGADEPPPEIDPGVPPVSKPGDVWRLDRHRIGCGDARDPETLMVLMADERAGMVFIDPPYNVPIDGHVGGKGSIRHPEFVMASGELSEREFTDFLATSLANHAACCADSAILFSCIDWRHLCELSVAARQAHLSLLNLCVWVKTNGGLGSLYRSQHELVFVLKKGKAAHTNNVELGRFGRNRTNVWTYAGVNTFRTGRLEELAMHPTVKPVALVADAILDCSRRGDIVLDGFAGSGTTVIAAEKTGRRAYALEIDPRYVDAAIRRWEAFTHERAVHAETGLPFADIAKARLAGEPDVPGQRVPRARRPRHGR